MPRNTCRPSECNGTGDKDTGQNEGSSTAEEAAATAVSIVKQEFDAAPPVSHRKSERRKFARDIFLVFEEQTTRRRRGKGGARGKSRTLAKQKFGHLSVANTPRINKNLLREIKTEPKCSQAAGAVAVAAATQVAETAATVRQLAVPVQPEPVEPEQVPEAEAQLEEAEQEEPQQEEPQQQAEPERLQQLERQSEPLFVPLSLPLPRSPPAPVPVKATVKLETKTAAAAASPVAVPALLPELSAAKAAAAANGVEAAAAARAGASGTGVAAATTSTPSCTSNSPVATPSVNPIFLWVKQDDTRIVEVRCEDYDKRNRIRLTKTTNGWRSMPRTDASSSRIVKFFHSAAAAAPLLKVKREQLQQLQQQTSIEQELQEAEQQREQEEEEEQEQQQQEDHDWSEQTANANLIEDVLVVLPAQQQQEQQQEQQQQQSDLCFDALLDSETNASTKATKTSTSNANTPTYQCSSSASDAASSCSSRHSLLSPAQSTASAAALELQLCPKTGLFLPQGVAAATVPVETLEEQEQEAGKANNLCTAEHSSLDAHTKNLKDLLDDADELLQQCSSDNGSSGAELLDSLVQRSCEDNLTTAGGAEAAAAAVGGGTVGGSNGLSSFCVPDVVAGKELPSILGMDSSDDAPKCLSFNEAGEIEGLHGDLFLNLDSFEKQSEAEVEALEEQQPVQLTETVLPTSEKVPDETPKDLSYKKREEVCPPSESRSQCAVTSSSDVLKAKSPEPVQLQLPASNIPAEVETTSETIKHLILEQFLKLNAGNTQQQQQQAEPMDLGKAAAAAATVVIDDDDEEEVERDRESVQTAEPLKKRAKPPNKLDKDPDALTQLKMLISNPQWKVPDPILVPKDRLGAVLASPAREIPLLLTTRPELRLPEAFAYPQIIQNPNILVVTMEQLEAILKNDAEQVKGGEKQPSVAATPPSQPLHSPASLTPKLHAASTAASAAAVAASKLPLKSPASTPTVAAAAPSPAAAPQPAPAAAAAAPPPSLPATPAADSSLLSSELNATTLALLQQMLWLPYFGQLSQEFFKTLKDPLGLQRKFMSNLLPLYQSQFGGLQQLDELYKHCLKQKPEATAPTAAAPAAAKQSAPAFSNPLELAFMQQLLQQQQQQQQQQQLQAKESSSTSSSSSAAACHHHLEHKRARRDADIPDYSKQSSKTGTVSATPPATPTPATEHKPRLTCKSLSNLLEPDSNAVQLLNVPYRAGKTTQQQQQQQQQQHELSKEPSGRTLRSSKACVNYNPLEQAKQVQQTQQQRKRGNMLLAHELQQQQQQQQHQQQQQQQHQQQQQQQHLAEAAAAAAAAAGGNMDAANAALWHPLFGSNAKQGYNSPWQWTTVTATGE